MSTLIDEAVEALNARLNGTVGGCARFVFEGEGSVILDAAGARAGSDSDGIAADVTLTASPETFVAIFEGELAPSRWGPRGPKPSASARPTGWRCALSSGRGRGRAALS
ncbi:MAG: SCP2 sterol-binding domain-containing protein [Gemmobacter sp.]